MVVVMMVAAGTAAAEVERSATDDGAETEVEEALVPLANCLLTLLYHAAFLLRLQALSFASLLLQAKLPTSVP